MAYDTIAALSDIFKTQYPEKIRSVIGDQVLLYKQLSKEKGKYEGKSGLYIIPLNYAFPQGFGSRPAGTTTLPTASASKFKQSAAALKYFYGTLNFDNDVLTATRGDTKLLSNLVDTEFANITQAATLDVNRMLASDGTGVIAMCTTTTASTTLNLATTAVMNRFQPYMVIDLVNASNSVVTASNVTIADINWDAQTLTLDTAVTCSVGDGIFRRETYELSLVGSAPTSFDVMGLPGLVAATGSIQTLDPSSAGMAFWAGLVTAHASGVDENIIERMINNVANRGRGKTDVLISAFTQRRAYISMLEGTQQYSVRPSDKAPRDFYGGWSEVAFLSGNTMIPFSVDDMLDPTTVIGLDSKSVAILEQSDSIEWLDGDKVLSRKSGTATWEAAFFWYFNLVTYNRAANWKLTSLPKIY